jgi:PAS domain S-box-containing protein
MAKWPFGKNPKQKQERDAILKQALSSSEALEKAAKGTMNLAADVTMTLQAKIDDYVTQIDSTARLLSDALLTVTPEGNIQSFNPAAEEMFGWKKRDIMGKNIALLFQFKEEQVIDKAFMDNLIQQVDMDSGSEYESFMGLYKEGRSIYVDVSASKITRTDKEAYYIMVVRDVTHKVKNTQVIRELAAKNQELLTTIDASSTGFMILEPDGSDYKISFVNNGLTKIVGYSKFEIKQMNLRDLFGVDQTFWVIRKTLIEGIEGRHEIQFETGLNQVTWFDVHITPVGNGINPSQWILVFYNTTELKKVHHNLRKSEAQFKAFSDASSESMMIHDQINIREWNDRLGGLTGYSDTELAVMSPFDLLHPLQREIAKDQVAKDAASSFETLFLTKTGDVKEVAVNSRSLDWDNAEARIVIMRDVTEYKDIETQLKTARERYRTVIDNTIDMVICFNADLEITFSNQTFRDYFDVEVEDINGFSLLEIIPDSDQKKFKEYMLSITPESDIRRGIHRVQRHDEVRWQDWIDRGIFDEDGTLIEVQSVARDITHLIPNKDSDS